MTVLRKTMLATTALLLATTASPFMLAARADETAAKAKPAASEARGDLRQMVAMPEEARQLMREEMLGHLAALNEMIGLLAENKLSVAAEVAETRMGKSSMGKNRATGAGPGRYMPLEMRNLGWGMHEQASEFARLAREGREKELNGALQKITAACVVCHYSYRTR